MPCGKCCGQSAKRASACAEDGSGAGASPGLHGGQEGGQDNGGSEGGQGSERSTGSPASDAREGSESEAGSAATQAVHCGRDATDARAPNGAGILAQEGAQLVSWVASAPAVTSPRAARRSVLAMRLAAGRRRAREREGLEDLGLALGMGRAC